MGCCASKPRSYSLDYENDDADSGFRVGETAASFDPERARRKCTDVIFLILFGIFWVAMFVCFSLGLAYGDLNALLYPRDYVGEYCGPMSRCSSASSSLNNCSANYPLLFTPEGQIPGAVSGSSSSSGYAGVLEAWAWGTKFAICSESCYEAGTYICGYDTEARLREVFPGTYDPSVACSTGPCGDRAAFVAGCVADDGYASGGGGDPSLSSLCENVHNRCYAMGYSTKTALHRCVPDLTVDSSTSRACETYVNGICTSWNVTTTTSVLEPENAEASYTVFAASVFSFADAWGDVTALGWEIALFGLVAPLIAAVLYSFLLPCATFAMVWASLVVLLLLELGTLVLALFKAGALSSPALNALIDDAVSNLSNEAAAAANATLITSTTTSLLAAQASVFASLLGPAPESARGYFIALAVICGLFFLATIAIIVALRRRISLAVAVLSVAGRAVRGTLSAVVLVPLSCLVLLVLLWGFVIVSSALVVSMEGSIQLFNVTLVGAIPGQSTTRPAASFADTFTDLRWVLLAILLFGLLWTNAFILGGGVATVAGCVGKWYWTRDKDRATDGLGDEEEGEGDGVGGGAGRRCRCCCKREGCLAGWGFPFAIAATIFRFHLGTLALGSLLVAIVQFIRWCFELAQAQARYRGDAGYHTSAGKSIRCVVRCCLWCFERVIKFVTETAYVLTAVCGWGFCKSSSRAMALIAENPLRFAAVQLSVTIMTFFGKLIIAGSCTVGFYFFAEWTGKVMDAASYALPIILVFILSYIVASAFVSVFDTGVDTIFLSFCLDEKHNGRDATPFAPESIRRLMQVTQAQANEDKLGRGQGTSEADAFALAKGKGRGRGGGFEGAPVTTEAGALDTGFSSAPQ